MTILLSPSTKYWPIDNPLKLNRFMALFLWKLKWILSRWNKFILHSASSIHIFFTWSGYNNTRGPLKIQVTLSAFTEITMGHFEEHLFTKGTFEPPWRGRDSKNRISKKLKHLLNWSHNSSASYLSLFSTKSFGDLLLEGTT